MQQCITQISSVFVFILLACLCFLDQSMFVDESPSLLGGGGTLKPLFSLSPSLSLSVTRAAVASGQAWGTCSWWPDLICVKLPLRDANFVCGCTKAAGAVIPCQYVISQFASTTSAYMILCHHPGQSCFRVNEDCRKCSIVRYCDFWQSTLTLVYLSSHFSRLPLRGSFRWNGTSSYFYIEAEHLSFASMSIWRHCGHVHVRRTLCNQRISR